MAELNKLKLVKVFLFGAALLAAYFLLKALVVPVIVLHILYLIYTMSNSNHSFKAAYVTVIALQALSIPLFCGIPIMPDYCKFIFAGSALALHLLIEVNPLGLSKECAKP